MSALVPNPTTLNLGMVALRPVWVPYEPGEKASASALRAQQTGRTGPNGEPAESGRWKLQLPDGQTYDGPTISASGLGTAAECMWKWGLDRIDNIPRPPNHKADIGGERHDELEGWLKYAKQPYTQGMAQVLAHFPMPGQCESEVYFGFMFGRPGHEVVFSGYLDARESAVDSIGKVAEFEFGVDIDGNEVLDMNPGLVRRMNSTIRDLKTTGSFDWKKTAAQLRADIQACMYGLGEMLRIEAALLACGVRPAEARERSSLVILKWTYALLKENKDKTCTIRKVETVCETGSTPDPTIANGPNGGVLLTREQAVATVASYLPVAESMLAAIVEAEESERIGKRKKSEELGLGKNGTACASYGGCGWKKIGSLVRIEKRRDGFGREWEEKVEDVACSPPQGSGFMALLKQERERLKIGTGEGSGSGTETRKEIREKPMGLGARFGNRTGTESGAKTNQGGTESKPETEKKPEEKPTTGTSSANGAVSKSPPSATPAATNVLVQTGGLSGRFAKKPDTAPKATTVAANTSASTTPEQSAKLETKAQADGMASSASQPGALQAGGPPGESLMARLKRLNKEQNGGANEEAITKAVENAPTQSVTGAKAVGVNPPDAAPEWTAEQQKAEAERLAGIGKADAEKAAAKAEAEKAAAAGTTAQPAAVARAGRGGRKKAVEAQVDAALAGAQKNGAGANGSTSGDVVLCPHGLVRSSVACSACDALEKKSVPKGGPFFDDDTITVAAALAQIDDIATKLMKAGFRKEAGTIMQMSAALV